MWLAAWKLVSNVAKRTILRQMRSIPHCSKAVFYVFVFDSIHNSATMHNLSPHIFYRT